MAVRRKGRVDVNQAEVVAALRAIGAAVAITSSLGGGFPDLVVGYRGVNWLLEVKDGNKPPSGQRLTPDEIEFHGVWGQHAPIYIVNSPQQAVDLVSGG